MSDRGEDPCSPEAPAPGPADDASAKAQLHEIASRQGWLVAFPIYQSGPAGPFTAELLLDGRLVARGQGRSKADAERAAAAAALRTFGPDPLPAADSSGDGGFAEQMQALCLTAFQNVCPATFPRRTVVAAFALQVPPSRCAQKVYLWRGCGYCICCGVLCSLHLLTVRYCAFHICCLSHMYCADEDEAADPGRNKFRTPTTQYSLPSSPILLPD
jgi:hypothetical protein